MDITQKIVLDYKRNSMPPVIPVMQGDSGSRMIEAYLLSGGVAWTIPDGIDIVVTYCRADGQRGAYDKLPDGSDPCTANGNRLTIRLVGEVLGVPGVADVAIVMLQGEVQLSTFRFRMLVDPNPGGGAYPSTYINLETWFQSHKIPGIDGATFVPRVENGYLVWSNNNNLPNPPPFYVGGTDIEIGNAFEPKRLEFFNINVPKSAFVSNSEYAGNGFSYRAAIPLTGVLQEMVPDVVFSVADVVAGIFCPVAACYSGGVYIYAASIPSGVTTIPTITCRRAVS